MENEAEKLNKDRDIYDVLEIDSDVRVKLEAAASELLGITRRSTEQTFALGEHLERAAALLPDGQFNKWLDKRCAFSARNGRLYRAVARDLTPYKKTLVELGIGATVLGKLSSAEPDQISEAIAFAKEHGRLKASDVNAILRANASDDQSADANPYDVGGLAGLKTLMTMKQNETMRLFVKACHEMQEALAGAVGDKRIQKKELMNQVVVRARQASQYLESLTFMLSAPDDNASALTYQAFPQTSYWHQAASLLQDLGKTDKWPVATELRPWLEVKVVPILSWITSRDKSPSWNGEVANRVSADARENDQPVVQPNEKPVVEEAVEAAITAPAKGRSNRKVTTTISKPPKPVNRAILSDAAAAVIETLADKPAGNTVQP